MTTIIKFYRFDMSHVCDNGIGFAYDATKAGDMSGEYVPLAEYQEAINLVNELGEKDVQNRLQIDKLKALIRRVNEMDLGTDCDRYENLLQSNELEQLLADCKEAVE